MLGTYTTAVWRFHDGLIWVQFDTISTKFGTNRILLPGYRSPNACT